MSTESSKLQKKLFEYALWYTSRYQVSEKLLILRIKSRIGSLAQKLQSNESSEDKSSEDDSNETVLSALDVNKLIECVLNELSPYYDEISCARSLIQHAQITKKSPVKALDQLQAKLFHPDTIGTIKEEFHSYIHDFESLKPRIEQRIRSLAER